VKLAAVERESRDSKAGGNEGTNWSVEVSVEGPEANALGRGGQYYKISGMNNLVWPSALYGENVGSDPRKVEICPKRLGKRVEQGDDGTKTDIFHRAWATLTRRKESTTTARGGSSSETAPESRERSVGLIGGESEHSQRSSLNS